MYTRDAYYKAEEENKVYVMRTPLSKYGYSYLGKPEYIKRVEQRATAVIMARQLKKGVFHGI